MGLAAQVLRLTSLVMPLREQGGSVDDLNSQHDAIKEKMVAVAKRRGEVFDSLLQVKDYISVNQVKKTLKTLDKEYDTLRDQEIEIMMAIWGAEHHDDQGPPPPPPPPPPPSDDNSDDGDDFDPDDDNNDDDNLDDSNESVTLDAKGLMSLIDQSGTGYAQELGPLTDQPVIRKRAIEGVAILRQIKRNGAGAGTHFDPKYRSALSKIFGDSAVEHVYQSIISSIDHNPR